MPESPVFSPRAKEPPVDPNNKHLSAAFAAVVELLKPSKREIAEFGAKLAGEQNGVG